MLTPSSNTVLEPVTTGMLRQLPEISVHFARFTVTEISLAHQALSQFNEAPMLTAAQLLADAKVDVIAWNGTSAGWLGFESDRALCRRIEAVTGIRAITSVLSLVEIMQAAAVTRLGLVTPYISAVQERIVATFAAEGIECVAERHFGVSGNFSFAEIGDADIVEMIRDVATARPQAITMLCTNLAGAPLVEALERDLDIPILDSVSAVVWKALQVTGIDPSRVTGWGRLFGDRTLADAMA